MTECLTISCNDLNMDSCFKWLVFLPLFHVPNLIHLLDVIKLAAFTLNLERE